MPGIFINYRREDSGGYAQQIYRPMRAYFGAKLVFMDTDTIRSGEDYRAIIREAIAQSDVFLAVIGRAWLRATDDQGNSRLSYPADLVRREIAQALEAGIHVVPVLVGRASMPRADALPDDLKPLAAHNAHEIPDHFFDQSVRQLIQTIRPQVRGKREISRRAILYGTGGTAAVLLAAAIADGAFKRKVPLPEQARTVTATAEDLKYAELEKSIKEIRNRPSVVTRKPGNIDRLPGEVAGPWKIDRTDFSAQVTGPQQEPKVVWISRVSVGDEWKPIGFAPDQTLFLHDDESRTLFAIKDGTEQWAFNTGNIIGVTPGGLIVLQQEQLVLPWGSTFLCFNSRGEGGICHRPLKQPSNLIPGSTDSRSVPPGVCEGGAITFTHSKTVVPLDGNCARWSVVNDDQGRIYVGTDRGTLYCFSSEGKLLWTYKGEQASADLPLFSLGDVVFGADDHLVCVRDGAQRWSLPLNSCKPHLVDKAGTIFVSHESKGSGPILQRTVSAVDHSGRLLWSMPTGGEPVILDPQGRLYVADPSAGFLLCLA